jgi:two-component system response regulator MprA
LEAEKEVVKTRILIIDDEPKMVDFLKLGLAYEGFEVEYAYDGLAGLKMALENQPDLLILDLMLPGLDGFEVCQRLKPHRDIPIIMLTARGELDERVNGLNMGADDYLTKPFQFKELVARIRAVLRRHPSPSANPNLSFGHTYDYSSGSASESASPRIMANTNTLKVYDISFDPDLREFRRGSLALELTQREADLLKLLMSHPNRVMTRDIILNNVWGYDFKGDFNVIEVYIRYLRQKLGEPDLIHTVRGVGYVMRSQPKNIVVSSK